MFLDDLFDAPLEKEKDLGLDLLLNTQPISFSPWGAPILFFRRNMIHMCVCNYR